jgi:hypothetical protein
MSAPEPHAFYTAGGTLKPGGAYVWRKADDELLGLCRAGTFAYLLTARQMGKSSLMERTARRLREEGVGTAGVDLSQIGTQVTAESWYLGILVAIADDLAMDMDVVVWWQEHQHLGIGQRISLFFQDLVLRVPGRIVVFIDEIDTTLSLSFTDDLFAVIRSLYNSRGRMPALERLSFVLIGAASETELIRDPQRTPFNIGQRVELTCFSFDEARPLAAGLPAGDQGERERMLRRVLWWTDGQPYLTQRLCGLIAQKNAPLPDTDIDALVTATFFGRSSDPNLSWVRDMLTRRAPNVAAVLWTYRAILAPHSQVADEEQVPAKAHLKLAGVVRREERWLRVRNAIYRSVFDQKWVRQSLWSNWKQLRRAIVAVAALSIAVVGFAALAWNVVRLRREAAVERAGRLEAVQKMLQLGDQAAAAQEIARLAKQSRAEASVPVAPAPAPAQHTQKEWDDLVRERDLARAALSQQPQPAAPAVTESPAGQPNLAVELQRTKDQLATARAENTDLRNRLDNRRDATSAGAPGGTATAPVDTRPAAPPPPTPVTAPEVAEKKIVVRERPDSSNKSALKGYATLHVSIVDTRRKLLEKAAGLHVELTQLSKDEQKKKPEQRKPQVLWSGKTEASRLSFEGLGTGGDNTYTIRVRADRYLDAEFGLFNTPQQINELRIMIVAKGAQYEFLPWERLPDYVLKALGDQAARAQADYDSLKSKSPKHLAGMLNVLSAMQEPLSSGAPALSTVKRVIWSDPAEAPNRIQVWADKKLNDYLFRYSNQGGLVRITLREANLSASFDDKSKEMIDGSEYIHATIGIGSPNLRVDPMQVYASRWTAEQFQRWSYFDPPYSISSPK